MLRTRTFSFTIHSKDALAAWTYLCSIDNCYEYMCMNIKKNTIQGYFRFKHAKKLDTVVNLLHFEANIKEELRSDIDVRKALYYKDKFFESGVPKHNRRSPSVCTSTPTQAATASALPNKEEIVNLIAQCMVEGKEKFEEMCKNNQHSQPSTFNNIVNNNITNNTNNITNNNKVSFNLNMFLNEKCKDAMDITAFVQSIPIGLDDIISFKQLGHAEAISRIINKAYQNMDLTQRPMHCTDLKRETLYVKNDDKWTNDVSKALIERAIDMVATNSFSNLKVWKEANPDYNSNEDKKTEYARIMRQLLGGVSDWEMQENKNKIVRNVTRMAQLDKERALTV
jgi:hypothetical protein